MISKAVHFPNSTKHSLHKHGFRVRIMPSVFGLLFTFAGLVEIQAQQIAEPRSPLLQCFLEEEINGSGLRAVHPAIRPLVQHAQFDQADQEFLSGFIQPKDSKLHQFSQGHFLEVKKKWFGMQLNPIFQTMVGGGSSSGLITDMVGGLRGDLFITPKLIAHFSFRGGAFKAPAHVEEFMNTWGVKPGYGDFQRANGLSTFFDPRGYLSFSPSEHFNVQAGHDKLFIGNGYRSLLLSDNAPPYSFLKLDTRFWKIRYVNIFANFKDIRPGAASRDKLGTFHYLSVNLGKRFSVGLFESITWQAVDSSGARGFEPNYINPIIFYRPVEFSLNSPDNVLLGLDLRIRIGKNHHLYGQLVLDEFSASEVFAKLSSDTSKPTGWWANKQGFQVGLKGWSPFGLKNLYYQTEFNWVRPFTYTHVTVEQNHGHYNQALAHPRGANFMESVNILRFRKNNWLLEAKFIYSRFGLDTNAVSYGGNIFRSYLDRAGEYDHEMYQGLETELFLWQVRAEYVLNAFWDMRVIAGFNTRLETSALHRKEDIYVFFGISTDLSRPFDDF